MRYDLANDLIGTRISSVRPTPEGERHKSDRLGGGARSYSPRVGFVRRGCLNPRAHQWSVYIAAALVLAASSMSDGRAQITSRGAAPPREGTGAISGVVVDAQRNSPLAGAVVLLFPPDRQPIGQPTSMVTDAKGRFVFDHLPDFDSFLLRANKPGYVSAGPASGSVERRPLISVTNGEWVRDVRIALARPPAISGTVRDGRGEPIVGALVRAIAKASVAGRAQTVTSRSARTDDRGMYRIAGLSPGSYFVQMQAVQDAFSSTVRNEQLITNEYLAGRRGLGPLPNFGRPTVVEGNSEVALGRYPLPPRSTDGRMMIYPVTFHPVGSSFSDAVSISVAAGDDRTDIDLQVREAHGVRISGMLDGPPDSYADLTLRLMLPGAEDLGPGGEVATALVADGGHFTFVNVPPGEYLIDARRQWMEYNITGGPQFVSAPPDGPEQRSPGFRVSTGPEGAWVSFQSPNRSSYWGRERVTVGDRNLDDVLVVMKAGLTLSGRLLWEGKPRSTPSAEGEGVIHAQPADGNPWLGIHVSRTETSTPDRFSITGLVPGEYVLAPALVLVATGTRVKSIVCGGRDYTYAAIDISAGVNISDCAVTLTDKAIRVAGKVRDTRGQVGRSILVMAFPVEKDQWAVLGLTPARFKSVQVRNDGLFQLDSLPAGDYFLIAVPEDKAGLLFDPKFLEAAIPLATRLHLEWGQNVTQDLTQGEIK